MLGHEIIMKNACRYTECSFENCTDRTFFSCSFFLAFFFLCLQKKWFRFSKKTVTISPLLAFCNAQSNQKTTEAQEKNCYNDYKMQFVQMEHKTNIYVRALE